MTRQWPYVMWVVRGWGDEGYAGRERGRRSGVFASANQVLRNRPPEHGHRGRAAERVAIAGMTGFAAKWEPRYHNGGRRPAMGTTTASAGVEQRRSVVFYDGECALCQGFVRFLLLCDRDGSRFLFSPLQGHLITRIVPAEIRETLPDTLVLRTTDGKVRIRSEAVLGALDRLGGIWRVAGILGRMVPRRVRDWVYASVARTRREMFGGTHYHCPLVPADLRDRFVD